MGPLEVDNMSTGGFSHYFDLPDYQQTEVQSWITNNNIKPNKAADFTKRAVPDVSGQSSFITIIVNGESSGIGGTSGAAPVLAGVFSILNQKRLEKGLNTLGFANYFI